jgi:hypothetical protein
MSEAQHSPNAGSSTLFGPGSAQTTTLHDRIFGGYSSEHRYGSKSRADEVRRCAIEHSQVAEEMIACGDGRTLHIWFDLLGENEERFETLLMKLLNSWHPTRVSMLLCSLSTSVTMGCLTMTWYLRIQ